jgi:hypothetical protein
MSESLSFTMGEEVLVRYGEGTYPAKIIEVPFPPYVTKYQVHYLRFNRRHDEYVDLSRLRKKRLKIPPAIVRDDDSTSSLRKGRASKTQRNVRLSKPKQATSVPVPSKSTEDPYQSDPEPVSVFLPVIRSISNFFHA